MEGCKLYKVSLKMTTSYKTDCDKNGGQRDASLLAAPTFSGPVSTE